MCQILEPAISFHQECIRVRAGSAEVLLLVKPWALQVRYTRACMAAITMGGGEIAAQRSLVFLILHGVGVDQMPIS